MVFKTLVKTILRYQREPDNILLTSSISSLKHEITNDLIEAFKLSSDLIKNNQSLFNESYSFLDFLTKICGQAPTVDYKENIKRNVQNKLEQSDFNKEIEKLNNKLKQLEMEKNKDKEKINELNTEKNKDKEKINELNKEKNTDKEKINELNKKINMLKENEKQLTEKYENDLCVKNDEIKRLKEDNATIRLENEKLKIDIDTVKLQNKFKIETEKNSLQLELIKEKNKCSNLETIKDEQINELKNGIEKRENMLQVFNRHFFINGPYLNFIDTVRTEFDKLFSYLAEKNVANSYPDINNYTTYIQNILQNNPDMKSIDNETKPMIENSTDVNLTDVEMKLPVPTKLITFVIEKYHFEECDWEDKTIETLKELANLVDIYEDQRKALESNLNYINIKPYNMADTIIKIISGDLNESNKLETYILKAYPEWANLDWKEEWIKQHARFKPFLEKYSFQEIDNIDKFLSTLDGKNLEEISNEILQMDVILLEFHKNNLDDLHNMLSLGTEAKNYFKKWYNENSEKKWDDNVPEWYHQVLQYFDEKITEEVIPDIKETFKFWFNQHSVEWSETARWYDQVISHLDKYDNISYFITQTNISNDNLKDILNSTLELKNHVISLGVTEWPKAIVNTLMEMNNLLKYHNVYKISDVPSAEKQTINDLYTLFFNSQLEDTMNWNETILTKFKEYKNTVDYLNQEKLNNYLMKWFNYINSQDLDELDKYISKLISEKPKWHIFFKRIMDAMNLTDKYDLEGNLDFVLNAYVDGLNDYVINPKAKRRKQVGPHENYSELLNELELLKNNNVSLTELKSIFYTLYHYYFYLLLNQRQSINMHRNELKILEDKYKLIDKIHKKFLQQRNGSIAVELLIKYVQMDLSHFPQSKLEMKTFGGDKDKFVEKCMDDTKIYLYKLLNQNDDDMT